ASRRGTRTGSTPSRPRTGGRATRPRRSTPSSSTKWSSAATQISSRSSSASCCRPERTLFTTCASLLAEASAQGGDGLARESDLEDWLRTSYARAYRTACLILRNPADAEEVVQEAFLRVWRFRDAM